MNSGTLMFFVNTNGVRVSNAHFCTGAVRFDPLESPLRCLRSDRLVAVTGPAGGNHADAHVEGQI